MTILLIIRAGENYFRYSDDHFEPCTLSKASVFSLEQAELARQLCRKLAMTGVAGALLRKLTIVEEPFDQDLHQE